ncbi:MAG: 3-hydroxyacyl-ACP dehydratase FabZ [Atribacterota bacterium]|jgi:3-hydroxyacyl-[acyl-carrier-protein] dehydratase|nr:3-hydroxyacyl-ACP dehydratase FabZ [Atribacterota bacterium]MDD4895305.1 3-hydroxyacyl-ACP dehydratase FabZ [Atribacterota bacterium]MDD5636746.1 3-hydroxyacyl-ACP dehydratase FabZ [Atribacterota bacterium]
MAILVRSKFKLLKIDDIKKIIPHRYPFLLIDRIDEIVSGERAVGYKNVTANESFFQGHFPQEMVMPGVLVVESLAQVGAVAILVQKENRGKLVYFGGINKAVFKRKVIPGDCLRLEVEIIRRKGLFGLGRGTATVDGQIAVKAELLFALEHK